MNASNISTLFSRRFWIWKFYSLSLFAPCHFWLKHEKWNFLVHFTIQVSLIFTSLHVLVPFKWTWAWEKDGRIHLGSWGGGESETSSSNSSRTFHEYFPLWHHLSSCKNLTRAERGERGLVGKSPWDWLSLAGWDDENLSFEKNFHEKCRMSRRSVWRKTNGEIGSCPNFSHYIFPLFCVQQFIFPLLLSSSADFPFDLTLQR